MNLLEKNVQQFQHDGKIEKGHDWIDEWNCLRTKYFYRDYLHLVELGNKKFSNIIIKAIKHSNLTIPMNTSKYKDTTVLTGEDFPPLSRLSIKKYNPKLLPIMPPYENILFPKIVLQTQDSRCNNIISVTKILLETITTRYTKSKLRTENLTVIKICPATRFYQEKENTNQQITNFIQHHTQQQLQ